MAPIHVPESRTSVELLWPRQAVAGATSSDLSISRATGNRNCLPSRVHEWADSLPVVPEKVSELGKLT